MYHVFRFSRIDVKVSYSCTQDLGSITRSHNNKLFNYSSKHNVQPRNCRKKGVDYLRGNAEWKT